VRAGVGVDSHKGIDHRLVTVREVGIADEHRRIDRSGEVTHAIGTEVVVLRVGRVGRCIEEIFLLQLVAEHGQTVK
jgi:hypothetical protein